jgi:hypothetical protein
MPNLIDSAIRPDDFLYCQFEFINLVLEASAASGPQLRRAAPGPAFVVVRLPAQNVAEQALTGAVTPLPVQGALAGPSRLTFVVPADRTHIDYRLEALLEFLRTAELKLSDTLSPSGEASAIECPARLLLAPKPGTSVTHRARPFTAASGVSELWHTTLQAKGPSLRLRAIKNPDEPAGAGAAFVGALTQTTRDQINEHCRRAGQGGGDPHVIAASLMRLTTLGATARLKGDWKLANDLSLVAWEHESELGRDHEAFALHQGFLFPFGHRALLAEVTKRNLTTHLATPVAALVAEPPILTILEAERSYEDLRAAYPNDAREMPFRRIRIASAPPRIPDGTAPIPLQLVATDRAGTLIDCQATAIFVPATVAAQQAALTGFKERYKEHATVAIGGQRVAIVEDDDTPGDPSLNIERLTFGVKLPNELRAAPFPAFLPFMLIADARIPALEQMLGTTAGASPGAQRKATAISLHDNYLRTGLQPGDPKQVFAKFAAMPGLSIPPERAGGLAAPKFPALDGLSRLTGPVADVEGFLSGRTLSPEELVKDAKLLGVIALKDIIAAAGDDIPFPVAEARRLFDEVDKPGTAFLPRPVLNTIAGPSGVETRFIWKPRIAVRAAGPFFTQPNTELVLKGRINTSAGPGTGAAAFSVNGRLTNFRLSFLGITVRFNSVIFVSESGRKTDVKLDIGGVEFSGVLGFVNKLQQVLKDALPSGARGPSVQSLPDGITVRHAVPLPAVPLGALTMQNIAISTAVTIPFVPDKPASVRFALSERQNPFQIAVSIFGGTGFFAIELQTQAKGLRVEAALEFGGIATLNLVVVKGGVYLLVGIYFSVDSNGEVLIEAHLRLGGFVDVLGLISVSIEVYIALAYIHSRGVLRGTGRLTVGVKLLFFSESFSFEITKEIPAFGDAPGQTIMSAPVLAAAAIPARALQPPKVSATQWAAYCRAFA